MIRPVFVRIKFTLVYTLCGCKCMQNYLGRDANFIINYLHLIQFIHSVAINHPIALTGGSAVHLSLYRPPCSRVSTSVVSLFSSLLDHTGGLVIHRSIYKLHNIMFPCSCGHFIPIHLTISSFPSANRKYTTSRHKF